MSRPRDPRNDDRLTTSIRFERDLHQRLVEAADQRDVSVNWLVNRAVYDFLDRLIPVDEVKWTRD